MLERILDLRGNFSAYDACYVALAERIEATLVTTVRDHLTLAVVSYDL